MHTAVVPRRPMLAVVPSIARPAPAVTVRTDRPEALRRVLSDWLFQAVGPEGRTRLLREHGLLAVA